MDVLIAGRILQGAGAASILPLSLAIVADAFPQEEQAKAMGIWASVSSIALAIGPFLGGLLVDVDWRVIFWIDVPLAAAGVVIMNAVARESRDETAGTRVDWPGLILLTAGLVCVVLPLVEGEQWGWGSAKTLSLLAAGAVLLAGFVRTELRVPDPIVDFQLFRNGPYFGASAAAFALVGAYWCVMFFEAQYLQNVLDYSPTVAGLLILPITLPMVVVSPLAGRLIARFGTRRLMTFGMLCGLAGLLLITRTNGDSGYGLLLPAFLLFGLALGFVYAPMSTAATAAMAAMPRSKAGIASGVLAMIRVGAGALALAAVGAAFATLQHDEADRLISERATGIRSADIPELDGVLAGSESARAHVEAAPAEARDDILDAAADAFSYALANSFWILVGLVAAGTVLTWMYVRDPEPPDAVEEHELQHRMHHRRFHL